ncbi:Holliday junction resolvase RuvX [candidate division WS5 bacterium]|uniref:Putative pre-16S rRNA nuclease n=1 Tax=candidate division WS5 bacterium TaxID=2093353 RepID=A0A419DG88_9BACT|nr:MAG: Holliday junction resolvase RuvX [candidate division WS5 bacterium]
MSKYIALDVGEKRLGIARSDDGGSFAFPYITLDIQELPDSLKKILEEEKPEKIVVGLPRNMDGSLGFQSEKVERFVAMHLKEYKDVIEYEDESVTSIEAGEEMKREGKDPKKDKGELDAYAAKIILESWLKRQ